MYRNQVLKNTLFIVSIIFFSSAQSIFADTLQADTIKANEYLQSAQLLAKRLRYDSTIYFLKKAIPIFRKNSKWELYIQSSNLYGDVLSRMGQHEMAQKKLQKTLSDGLNHLGNNHLSIADISLKLGDAYERANNYTKGKEFYQKALDIRLAALGENHLKIAECHNSFGILYRRMGDFEKGIFHHEKALKIRVSLVGENDLITANSLFNLGTLCEEKGDIEKGKVFLEKALRIRLEKLTHNEPLIADCYNNLGFVLLKFGELQKAKDYFENALRIYRVSYDESSFLKLIYINIGSIHHRLLNFSESKEYYFKALSFYKNKNQKLTPEYVILNQNMADLWQRTGKLDSAKYFLQKAIDIQLILNRNHQRTADLYNISANIERDQKNYQEELEFRKKALAIYSKIYGEKHEKIAFTYSDIAMFFFNQKDYLQSLLFHGKAIGALSLTAENSGYVNSNPSINEIVKPHMAQLILKRKGNTLFHYYLKNNDQKLLSHAHSTYELCLELLDVLRKYENFQSLSKEFIENKVDIYDEAINVILEHYSITKDDAAILQAFEIAEKSKAFTIKQAIGYRESLTYLPDSIAKKETALRDSISSYEEKIISKRSESSIISNAIKSKLFEARQKLESLISRIEVDYPQYYELRYSAKVNTVADIQKKLLPDQIIIKYVLGKQNLYTFSIGQTYLRIHKTPTKQLNLSILTENIKSKDSFDVEASNKWRYSLYKSILQAVINQLPSEPKSLIIIPDGLLWNIDFDLLITEETQSTNPKKIPYLLKKYNTSYSYSASLFFPQKKDNNKTTKPLLAFSHGGKDASYKNKLPLSKLGKLRNNAGELPGSVLELSALSNVIAGDYYFGNLASEKQFKKIASQYQILHLAVHGETNDQDPMSSKLFFYSQSDKTEDGKLHAFEIYNMNLNADLAILSACNTGAGEIIKGDGIISIGRAFAYAGVNSLLLTRREVSDAVAPEIMKVFYRELKKGKNKSEALRQAKLEFLMNSNNISSNPFYWSSFYIIGDDSSIEFDSGNEDWYYAIVVIILILIVYMIRLKSTFG